MSRNGSKVETPFHPGVGSREKELTVYYESRNVKIKCPRKNKSHVSIHVASTPRANSAKSFTAESSRRR